MQPLPRRNSNVKYHPNAPEAPVDDSAILSLFRQWIEKHRALAAIVDDVDEIDAISDRECEIEHRIADTPAQGTIGLAIKLYIALYADHYAYTLGSEPGGLEGFDPDVFGDDPEQRVEVHSVASALRDAARFVPEIAILARTIIGEPVLRPDEVGVGASRDESAGAAA